ncbi:hypothetical protein HOLleu_39495 [Holothuria leucospilota]|uniref:Uncharacterized protein n=1 Tax=Holothuria leucospilota TaxID=206669 RepID=A0A9Q1BED5_HOLLE|nr:hypothetical protein HOLleu_39495 [Holothuria leucospilota]
MSKPTPTTNHSQSSINDDDDVTSAVKSKEIVNEILQELTNSAQLKSVLQGIIENVIERKLAKISEDLEKYEGKIFDLENKLDECQVELTAIKKASSEWTDEREKLN